VFSQRIALAKLVWAFDIRAVEGRVYDTMDIMQGGILQRPRPFECAFIIRGEKYRTVLMKELGLAEETLVRFPAFD
jgi:hypothetical protein